MAMTWDDYIEETRDNAVFFMENETDLADYADYSELHEEMVNNDGITGNGSGSYTYDRETAQENIMGIMGDDDLNARLEELGYSGGIPEPETLDVLVRIMALEDLYGELENRFESLKAQ